MSDTSEPSAERTAFEIKRLAKEWATDVAIHGFTHKSDDSSSRLHKAIDALAGQARAGAKESQPVAPSAINERWVPDIDVMAIGERVWRNGKPHPHDLIRFSDALRDELYTHSRAEAPPSSSGDLTERSGKEPAMAATPSPSVELKVREARRKILEAIDNYPMNVEKTGETAASLERLFAIDSALYACFANSALLS